MRPWSYSRESTWSQCPKSYWYSYVERLPSSRESPAASRGTTIHEKAERYLRHGSMYPHELQKVSAHAMYLKRLTADPEKQLAVREDWSPAEWDDPDVYYRGVIDIHYSPDPGVVCVEDWKTGQIYEQPHKTQLERYISLAAAYAPEATEFRARAVYIDQGVIGRQIIVPANRVQGIRLLIDATIKQAEEDKIYPTRTGPHCRFCDYSTRHGGPCPN